MGVGGGGGYFEDKGGAPAGARGCCFKKKIDHCERQSISILT